MFTFSDSRETERIHQVIFFFFSSKAETIGQWTTLADFVKLSTASSYERNAALINEQKIVFKVAMNTNYKQWVGRDLL